MRAGVLLAGFVAGACAPRGEAPVIAYENGHWFTGSRFESRTMYVQGNRFVDRPQRADSVIDLEGGYVVAPFGEAHNHNVDPVNRDALAATYLRSGVFYILNPNNLPQARDGLSGAINRPEAPDVIFANGGITGPGGHPIGVVERNVGRGVWTAAEGEGAFLFSVADVEGLDEAWPDLVAARPDLVKVYLLYSEAYEARLADPAAVGWRGLDPALVPEVTRRAREAGLRVAAHVESREDFRVAVEAGVQVIAHMPGFRGDQDTALPDPARYEISEADARLAARQGTVVVSTLAGLAEYAMERGDTRLRSTVDRLNRRNLSVLRDAGVAIAIGSDMYDDTSVREALYLSTLGVLDHAALLRSWSETTPRLIFPDRDLGRLAPGHEASFVVLEGDPLADFENVTRVRFAVKEGHRVVWP